MISKKKNLQKWQLGTVFLPDSVGYLIGTNFFAVPALKWGRHKTAMVALFLVAMSAISVSNQSNIRKYDRCILNYFIIESIKIMSTMDLSFKNHNFIS